MKKLEEETGKSKKKKKHQPAQTPIKTGFAYFTQKTHTYKDNP